MNQCNEEVWENSKNFKNTAGKIGCINMLTDYTLFNIKFFSKIHRCNQLAYNVNQLHYIKTLKKLRQNQNATNGLIM